MKKIWILTLILPLILFSCDESDQADVQTKSQIQFSINENSSKLKSVTENSLDSATTIVLTIVNENGDPTDYTSSEITLRRMNGNIYSERLTLLTGNYELTEFLLLNSIGNTIFAAPLEDSPLAVHVSDPLPIEFEVMADQLTDVYVEVISTENYLPEDFGFVRFIIGEVKLFNFLLNIIDSENDSLLSADLNIANGDYSLNYNIQPISNNVITLKDSIDNFTFTIEKEGYESYTNNFSNNELKDYSEIPLSIELNRIADSTFTVFDYDGNEYDVVKIGEQWWLAENLKSLHYADGTPISDVYEYNNDENNAETYGRLYSWNAAMNGSVIEMAQGACPDGWHIPSDDDWKTLEMHLGMTQEEADLPGIRGTDEGGKLKEAGTAHWLSPNLGATNESGFTALPAGSYEAGSFYHLNVYAFFWTSNQDDSNMRRIRYDGSTIHRVGDGSGMHVSIRCLKDE
ncbi:fibrobacter succinogenes major paralogous domain-containing protein [Bacteroidota bacterium]